MKKLNIFVIILYVFLYQNIYSKSHTHHTKNYIHEKIYHSEGLSSKEYEKLKNLRSEHIKQVRLLNRKLKNLRIKMNNSLIKGTNQDKYYSLKEETYTLRAEREALKESFMVNVHEISPKINRKKLPCN